MMHNWPVPGHIESSEGKNSLVELRVEGLEINTPNQMLRSLPFLISHPLPTPGTGLTSFLTRDKLLFYLPVLKPGVQVLVI